MNDKKLLQQVLDALKKHDDKWLECGERVWFEEEIKAIEERLAQPEPEPVAWMYEFGTDNADAVNDVRWYKNVSLTKPHGMVRDVVSLYTAPPKKEWVGLTDYEIVGIASLNQSNDFSFARAIEAKLKDKNT
jgi:hypothetical protein